MNMPVAVRERLTRLTHAVSHPRHHRIFQRFREFTMIPIYSYIHNLELAARFRHVPGAVVECGVWRGGMIAGIARLLGADRDYYLFDSFEGLPPAEEIDGAAARAWQADANGAFYHDNCAAPETAAREAMRRSGAKNVHVLKGWFSETLPGFEPAGGIAILRLDGDWYASTMDALTHLYPRVVPGGVVVLDDYPVWDGCRRAVHDYLSEHELPVAILQHRDDVTYFVKPQRVQAGG